VVCYQLVCYQLLCYELIYNERVLVIIVVFYKRGPFRVVSYE